MLIKYIKSVPWRVAKRVSYIEDARCLKVNVRGKLFRPRISAVAIPGLDIPRNVATEPSVWEMTDGLSDNRYR